ncbi:hypothetical protein [Serratia proteamaculans]|uniref:hypothetical protein n=1 Tax=Serratia proteamaculans TaxID=28151 RepID=UPI001020BA97|nr:hypothetical protein [Serratia proteamaculans]RYM55613.1 hypothetical protein BSQ96_02590 [Serratia proteamaculans]
MNVHEMEGFLRGKCLPGDLLVGESHAAYLVRKLNESATLKADRDAQQKRADALAVDNAELKARTVTVPAKLYVKDMRCNVVRWSQVIDAISEAGVAFVRDDGELIAGTRETPATDAALAAVRAQERADLISVFNQQIKNTGLDDEALVTVLECREALKHAVELREGK